MDNLADRIKAILEAKDMSEAQLSRHVGVSQQAINSVTNGNTKRPRYIGEIAKALDTSVDWLMYGTGSAPEVASKPAANVVMPPPKTDFVPGPQDLPIRGNVRGGSEGIFFDNGDIQGTAHRPGNLTGVPNAFACYVTGDSMEPRYFEGELLYVNPIKPVRPGDFVLIEMVDHQAFIKRLVRRTADKIIVRQYNPDKEYVYESDQVRRIYKVVGQVEG
tara:strand:- start:9998 stop:10651 length:654 start_codon:yes stop_codon:yes gene_type:complete